MELKQGWAPQPDDNVIIRLWDDKTRDVYFVEHHCNGIYHVIRGTSHRAEGYRITWKQIQQRGMDYRLYEPTDGSF